MKKRLHDKKAGVAILIALIVISLAEVIFRAVAMGEAVLTTANFGEQLAVIAFAGIILVLNAKGKDRICYICYGAWLAYFVFNHVFELPRTIVDLVACTTIPGIMSTGSRILCMVSTIVMGALIVEYMNDGTIYKPAFNALCVITIALYAIDILKNFYVLFAPGMPTGVPAEFEVAAFKNEIILVVFNTAHNVIMTFMFAFFAYDSAKFELKKAKLAK